VGAGRGFLSENESRMYDIQTLKEMRKRVVENLAKFAKMIAFNKCVLKQQKICFDLFNALA
jgi:hypothetical protein